MLQASSQVVENTSNYLGNTVDQLTGGHNNNFINSVANGAISASNNIAQSAHNVASSLTNSLLGGTQNVFGRFENMVGNQG